MIYYAVMWIKTLPNKNGISKKYSPNEIVNQREMDFKKNCQCEFGKYVEYRSDCVVTNDMKPRTHEVISL